MRGNHGQKGNSVDHNFSASETAFDVNQLTMKFRTKQQMPVGPLPAPKCSVFLTDFIQGVGCL